MIDLDLLPMAREGVVRPDRQLPLDVDGAHRVVQVAAAVFGLVLAGEACHKVSANGLRPLRTRELCLKAGVF